MAFVGFPASLVPIDETPSPLQVEHVLELLAVGMTIEEIIDGHPA
jgi:hypothetical protein